MELPSFRYHPDPVASGSVEASDAECACCKQSRGFIYTATVYSEDDDEPAVCPWCIADGSAHKKLKADFNDSEGIEDGVPKPVMNEIMHRTPGFATWQSDSWLACCGDAMAFLKPVGIKEIRRDDYEWEGTLMTQIVQNMGISGGAAVRLLESLNKDRGPTAYAFRCLHCNRHRFFIDNP